MFEYLKFNFKNQTHLYYVFLIGLLLLNMMFLGNVLFLYGLNILGYFHIVVSSVMIYFSVLDMRDNYIIWHNDVNGNPTFTKWKNL